MILLFAFLAAINTPLSALLWLAMIMFFHLFGQFAYGLPVYHLLKEAGYPKVDKGFVWSSIIPLIMLLVVIIYLIINYEWSELYSPKMWA